MKIYDFELVLSSGDVDINNLPNDLMFNIYEELGSEKYVSVQIESVDDLKKLKDYADDGYFGCSGRSWNNSIVIDFELNQVVIYDDYLE